MFWMLAGVGVAAPLDPYGFAAIADTLDPATPVVVDTDIPSMLVDGQTLLGVHHGTTAVFTFGQVLLEQPVVVSGDRPFALLSQGALHLDAIVDANAQGHEAGPGGYDGGEVLDGEAGSGFGGGSVTGGAGAGGGGFGGAGGQVDGVPGGNPNGDLTDLLEGGSGGGKSDNRCDWEWIIIFVYVCWENGDGGGGGGAVELGAAGILNVGPSGGIAVDGADGDRDSDHGGGGGAGGGILLHGSGGTCEGLLWARGGGGGDGEGGEDGGGGGGGRIVVQDLETMCATDVSGGPTAGPSSGASPGEAGEVVFRAWEPPDVPCTDVTCDGTEPPDADTAGPDPTETGAAGSDEVGDRTGGPVEDLRSEALVGCGCGAGGASGWLTLALALGALVGRARMGNGS